MDKQSLDLIEEGQQVDQWAVKQLLSSLRAAEQERDQYKAESIQYANLFQELSVKSANEIESLRAQLAANTVTDNSETLVNAFARISELEGQLKAAQEQEPVGKVRKVAHGGPHAFQMYDNLPIGESEVYVAAPIPAQRSPAALQGELIKGGCYEAGLWSMSNADAMLKDGNTINGRSPAVLVPEQRRCCGNPVMDNGYVCCGDYLYGDDAAESPPNITNEGVKK